jgi:hypothetical protein
MTTSQRKKTKQLPLTLGQLQLPLEQEKEGFSSRDNTLSDDMLLNGDGSEYVELAKTGSKTKGLTFP